MEFDNAARACFFLAWCLLVTTAIALTGRHGAGAALEASNATIPRGCRGGECLITYQQTEVKLMEVLDLEHDALASMLAPIGSGAAVNGAKKPNNAGCGRPKPRYTPCPPRPNPTPKLGLYNRGR
ncbi:hypothetical protein ACJRO7_035549 [Eucalyptus globulus]|uniref:Uncharacterized protein n=1 Tax=Eucalyptus globulus TaxID=34317 RepID=A0ABD3J6B0_EUCGL